MEFFKVRVQNLWGGGGGEGLVSSKSWYLATISWIFNMPLALFMTWVAKLQEKFRSLLLPTFTETANCTWKASGTQGKVATSYNLKISQLTGVISPLCFKPLVSHPWLILCAVIFRVKIAASCRHFEHTCWRLFMEKIENVMLWLIN